MGAGLEAKPRRPSPVRKCRHRPRLPQSVACDSPGLFLWSISPVITQEQQRAAFSLPRALFHAISFNPIDCPGGDRTKVTGEEAGSSCKQAVESGVLYARHCPAADSLPGVYAGSLAGFCDYCPRFVQALKTVMRGIHASAQGTGYKWPLSPGDAWAPPLQAACSPEVPPCLGATLLTASPGLLL